MKRRLLVGLMFVSSACSSTAATGDGGPGGTTGNAGTGASGDGGAAGTTGGGGRGGATTTANQSVLERNKNPSRDGHFIQPGLTKAAAATMSRSTGFAATFSGDMWASPLYMENGPGGTGAFFAVTTGNDVIALDETTGAVKWMRNLGSSPTANGVNCGGIHPLGIISTPVIDGATRTMYVGAATGTNSITEHQIHALNIEDGTSRTGWPVGASTVTAGSLAFMPPPQNQRSALSLVGGTLYVAYGGHVGDCGPYHGWVIGINTANPTMRGGWATGGQGEGIWAAGGMASDGNGVLAVTGNRTGGGSSTHQDSEQVVRITGLNTRADIYYPSDWMAMDTSDADFGSVNPMVVQLPGATPSSIVVAITKHGHMFLLDAAALRGTSTGAGGHKVDFMVANGNMAIHTAPASYRTANGLYVVLSTTTGAVCPSGSGVSGRAVVAVRIAPGNPPVPTVAWCAPMSSPTTGPIATTTDGTSDAVVWYMSGGRLVGVDGDTGAQIYQSSNTCSGVRQWSSPIAVKRRIIAGGDTHLCSWSAP